MKRLCLIYRWHDFGFNFASHVFSPKRMKCFCGDKYSKSSTTFTQDFSLFCFIVNYNSDVRKEALKASEWKIGKSDTISSLVLSFHSEKWVLSTMQEVTYYVKVHPPMGRNSEQRLLRSVCAVRGEKVSAQFEFSQGETQQIYDTW